MFGTRINSNIYLAIKEGYYHHDGKQFGNYIAGHIKSIQIKEKITQDQKPYQTIDVILAYEETKYYVSLPIDSLGRQFMLAAPNLDLDAILSINLGVKDAKYTYLWLEQHNKTVKSAWTKESPGTKPDWRQTANGFDKTAEIIYLKNELSKVIYELNEFLRVTNGNL